MKTTSKDFMTAWIAASAMLLTFSASPWASAADEVRSTSTDPHPKLYVGGLIGANFPNGDADSSKGATFGVTVGTKLAHGLGVGFLGTYYGQSNQRTFLGLPAGTSTRTYNLLGQINFFAADIVRIGADVGAMINTWSGNISSLSTGTSSTTLVYGPQASIDIPVIPGLTVGAEAHYLFNHESQNQDNLLLLGAVKVWL
jgi:hypothetical protein